MDFYVLGLRKREKTKSPLLIPSKSHSAAVFICYKKNKTDQSKRRIVGFCGEGVDGQKIASTFFRSIFIPTCHFLSFYIFSFSLFQQIPLENSVGGG
jgi:hypothetical protein